MRTVGLPAGRLRIQLLLALAVVFSAMVGVALVFRSGDRREAPSAPRVYGQQAVWSEQAVGTAVRACLQQPPNPLCFDEQMALAGASPDARYFYRERELVLVGFEFLGSVDFGTVVKPFSNMGIMFVILNGPSAFLLVDDLLLETPPLFPADPIYQKLLDAPSPRRGTRTLATWRGDNRFESHSLLPGGGQRFVFQAGLHDPCHACGGGVAARIALDFDSGGAFQQTALLGFCQGAIVTREVSGKVVTFHEFAGLNAGATMTEPYLILLPELITCPSSTKSP